MDERGAFRTRYGETALVTGASSGIGRAFARQLAEEGLRLVLVARRRALLDELARELRLEYGTRSLVVAADLTLPDAVQDLCEQIAWEDWNIDLLVNNAGVGRYGHFAGEDIQVDRNAIALNCTVPLELMQRLLPGMRARGRGGVICVGSLLADLHAPYFATYSASKAFIATLAQSLQAELAGSGVDLLLLVPGLTRTEFFAGNGISRELPFPASTPERVAQLALRALGRRTRVTQGWLNRLFRLSYSLMPGGMSGAINRLLLTPRPDRDADAPEGHS